MSVAGTGDFNGDGYPDVLVGAVANDAGGLNSGRAYLFYGGLTADATPDLVFTGGGKNYGLGQSVASAGDVNGDGYADIILGAYGYPGGVNQGRAYVYYGGPNPDSSPDLVFTGRPTDNCLGQVVASAGDVNGDGFSDLLVGAPGNSSWAGRAYIFYGGPQADDTPDVVLSGEAPYDAFGVSVSTAGDVNGDGYDDVIIGASGGYRSGRSYLFLGGETMDSAADLVFP
jgi:hypothetical protein